MKNGLGTYTSASGDIYQGAYEDDKKNGLGVQSFASGAV